MSIDQHTLTSPLWVERTQQLLNSWEHWLGGSLVTRSTPEEDAVRVAQASFVVVAHDGQSDPLLNFANQTALLLWEMSLGEFLGTPSRLTAEPVHRDERARLLRRTASDGYIADYSGIRIASSGRRFRIHQAVVWNVMDGTGRPAGQAATFADWTPLPVQNAN